MYLLDRGDRTGRRTLWDGDFAMIGTALGQRLSLQTHHRGGVGGSLIGA